MPSQENHPREYNLEYYRAMFLPVWPLIVNPRYLDDYAPGDLRDIMGAETRRIYRSRQDLDLESKNTAIGLHQANLLIAGRVCTLCPQEWYERAIDHSAIHELKTEKEAIIRLVGSDFHLPYLIAYNEIVVQKLVDRFVAMTDHRGCAELCQFRDELIAEIDILCQQH